MKKIILTTILSAITLSANATVATKVENIKNHDVLKITLQQDEEDKYLKKVYDKVPDMLDKGQESNQRSEKEGAALQFIMTSGLAQTGFAVDSFARLLNSEAAMVKEYVKDKKMKGYLLISHTLIFSKGYPDLKGNDLKQFKENSECQKGYCVLVNIANIKLLNEKREEINFDKEKFIKISKKYENKDKLWEINPNEIKEPYKTLGVKLITGFGLGGLDAMDLTSN